MELLDLKVGGIVIGTLLVIWGVGYMVREGCKDWREQRDLKKEVGNANPGISCEVPLGAGHAHRHGSREVGTQRWLA